MYFATDQYIRNLTDEVKREFDYRTVSAYEWKDWQSRFRKRLSEISGLDEVRTANQGLELKPQLLERVEEPSYIREKWVIQSEPGIWIPFYFLKPVKPSTVPMPVIITPHGHGRRGKEIYIGNYSNEAERNHAMEGDRDIAIQAVQCGYAVIAPDQRGFWEMAREQEVLKEERDSCPDLQKKAMLFGRTLIGERVHDMRRLIDFIQTQPELDTQRIGITGNSGGGTTSLFTAALDERISLCVPGSYFCTFHASVLTEEHCPCNIIPGILKLGEMYDIAGLIAPRPLLIVHGRDDEMFPSHATREAVAHTRKIYAAFEAEDRFDYYEGDGGHRYFKQPVWPFVKQYFN